MVEAEARPRDARILPRPAGRRPSLHDWHQRLAHHNISERGVHLLKTRQTISGNLTSGDVTQYRLDIRGYIDTAREHGLGAYEVLHQLITGTPWLAPTRPVSPQQRNQIRATVNHGPPR